MILAGMIRESESDLICDLAETYGVMDYRALPLKTAAALSAGLREGSRIKMRIAGQKAPTETILMAAIVDRLSLIAWMQTKDGARGIGRPESILRKLIAEPKKKDDVIVFETAEAFEKRKAEILAKGGT